MKDRRNRCERPPATSSGSAGEGARTFVATVSICFDGLLLASGGRGQLRNHPWRSDHSPQVNAHRGSQGHACVHNAAHYTSPHGNNR
jgi:hypothetical protein